MSEVDPLKQICGQIDPCSSVLSVTVPDPRSSVTRRRGTSTRIHTESEQSRMHTEGHG